MDGQDIQDREMLHRSLSKRVIGCTMEVIKELGSDFLESVYEKDFLIALADAGKMAKSQVSLHVQFRNRGVGDFFADILVEQKLLIEVKAVKAILPEHQAQIINSVNATGIEVGLLINFGFPKLEFKRFIRRKANEQG